MTNDANALIGKAVQRLRQAAGLSQAELADRLDALSVGIHQQTIARIERGTRPLKLTEAQDLARVLRVRLDELTYTGDELDAHAHVKMLIHEVNKAAQKADDALADLFGARIDLADWLLHRSADATDNDKETANGILIASDPAYVGERVRAEQFRQYFAELPGGEPDLELMQALGWKADEDGSTA